jgi:hypothetical protein
MGVDRSVYTGPYMIVKSKKVEFENSRYTCINESCKEFNRDVKRSDKFCSSCGKEHGERVYKDNRMPSISDGYDSKEFEEKFGDDHWFDDMWSCIENKDGSVDIYTLDVKDDRKHGYGFGYSADGDGLGPVTPEDITKELATANKEYKDKIDWILNIEGIESVEVKWGIVTYYS